MTKLEELKDNEWEYILDYLATKRTYTKSQQQLVDMIKKQIKTLKQEDEEKNTITK